MATNVGINGFGRIGMQVVRAIFENHSNELNVVAINDLNDIDTSAHLFKYDSLYGIYDQEVSTKTSSLLIGDRVIQYSSERNPNDINWSKSGAKIVIECTGAFTDANKAAAHIDAGAKKVIISAPSTGEDVTLVLGVNENAYEPENHSIISNASCTTNCVATMAKILHDRFGIEKGLMTTVHAYTNDQNVLDTGHTDLRRARAAAINTIPTTTGAARAVGLVMPELNGKLNGFALRVPTPSGSVTDLVVSLKTSTSSKEINAAYKEASELKYKNIISYTDRPIVSSDIVGDPHSCIIDGLSTMTIEGTLVKVVGWYDNEWGYSNRTADIAAFVADKGI